ncbi:MAG TPA: response regulator transcription factor [Mycobacteriales bacterium]|nr:response regulator transcription factor [Mycobacteriales bacterium]
MTATSPGATPAGASPERGCVLVVDDDDTVAEVVTRYLERAGFRVIHAADGPSALAAVQSHSPDLIVLDLMLPGMGGLEVCRRLRETSPVPVVMLTALGEETDRIAGLELGADDYVTKPFSPRELVLRVQSVLRRAAAPLETPGRTLLTSGDLVVDTSAREARRGGRLLPLTVREFDLLTFLLRHPRMAFDRAQLLEQVWGWTYGDHSTVTVHVRRLREKIEDDPARPRLLVTVWGIGYRWEAPEAADASDPSEAPRASAASEAPGASNAPEAPGASAAPGAPDALHAPARRDAPDSLKIRDEWPDQRP